MKKIITLCVALCATITIFAQTSTAVLVHNDSTRVFYGLNALADAHAAAVVGDIITLSSGTFTAVNLTKPITIRGAGMKSDTLGIEQPTIISGSFYIQYTETTNHLIMEGIQARDYLVINSPTTNPQFIKCLFRRVTTSGDNLNSIFINCLIGALNGSFINSMLYNCFVGDITYSPSSTLYNCICKYTRFTETSSLSAYNSILYADTYSSNEISGYEFSHCVGIQTATGGRWGDTYDPYFHGSWSINNTSIHTFDSVFRSFVLPTDTYNSNRWYQDVDFHLTDSAAANFLGSDGTQVGIYGGMFPFDPVPSYIIVRRCNVASRSTADGRLSVDIELISE